MQRCVQAASQTGISDGKINWSRGEGMIHKATRTPVCRGGQDDSFGECVHYLNAAADDNAENGRCQVVQWNSGKKD
ncbi:unnamed protein product [Taenia asiatica]|uniref:SCP domain-containing protein n=1 Tax=Taenia asiatica TaxID=60517 RepID=A0A0R3VX29_TAEAS|nr:unnamed protein product [Taenia asiatica]